MRDKRKQSIYIPKQVLEEINQEALRLDRSLSWLVSKAWQIALEKIKTLPSVPGK